MADTSNPGTPGLAHQEQEHEVKICRDVFGGTLEVRKHEQDYLPKFEREELRDYKARLKRSVLFNGFKITVEGLIGMIMRQDLEIDKLNPKIKDLLDDVDLEGNHIDVAVHETLVNALVDGHAHLFVDLQRVIQAAQTKADEQAMNLRPYVVQIRKQDLLRWTVGSVSGEKVVTSFAYQFCSTVKDGAFSEKEVKRVRQYDLVNGAVDWVEWEEVRTADGKTEWAETARGTMTIDVIPLVTIYAGRTGFMRSCPPLLDLALENILHYQTRSDRHNTLHICGVPIPVFSGAKSGGEQTVGPNHAIDLPKDGRAEYLEPKGTALAESRQELQDIEQRMATLGMSLLQRDTRAAETAQAKLIDKNEKDSRLALLARSLEDGLNQVIYFMKKWLGLDTKTGDDEIGVNDDFGTHNLDAQMISSLATLVPSKLSLETFWQILAGGGALPDDFDPVLEKARVDAEASSSLPPFMPRTPGVPGVPPAPGANPPVPPAPAEGGNG